ncbi:MAG: glycosyltransferase, partial [bacterium]
MEEQVLTNKETVDGKLKKLMSTIRVKVSVIVTVYNFEEEIADVFRALLKDLESSGEDFEVIFVDNGSVDSSWKKLKELAAEELRVKLIRMRTNFDESACFDAGLKQARGENVVFLSTRVRINPSQVSR